MPKHIHLLVTVIDACDDDSGGALGDCDVQNRTQNRNCSSKFALRTIPQFISSFKRYTNKGCQYELWQNGYYDHIIRHEQDYLIHCKYIVDNPAKWAEDKYYDTF